MPKKRTLNFKQIQQSYSTASAGSSSSHGAPGAGDSPATVNERLSELRQIETPQALQKKLDLAAAVGHASVPPELRGILGVPDTAPPKPKLGVRVRERMRTPGPAPPKSWLYGSSTWHPSLVGKGGKSRRKARSVQEVEERNRPESVLRLENLLSGRTNLAHQQPPRLVHLTLKRVAENWHLLDEEDYPALVDLPLRLRLRLLSYLGFFGPTIDVAALQALCDGHEQVEQLDLSGLAAHGQLSLKKLSRLLAPVKEASQWDDVADVAESWDTVETAMSSLTIRPATSRFAALARLSLSHPPPTAAWRDLLALAKNIPQVTHLSLAYWPRPTLTPNLVTATISAQGSPDVRAGASHYYSNIDHDFAEPATLLRQLSYSLLRLQWLDLEGCSEWSPALGTLAKNSTATILPADNDSWSSTTTSWNVFTETWKSLSYIRLAQGSSPSQLGLQAYLAAGSTSVSPALRSMLLKMVSNFSPASVEDAYGTDFKIARIWTGNEQRLFATQTQINAVRRERGCRPVTVDLDWVTLPS